MTKLLGHILYYEAIPTGNLKDKCYEQEMYILQSGFLSV